MTIHGKTMADMLKEVPDAPRPDQEVIRAWSKPLYREGHLAILEETSRPRAAWRRSRGSGTR